MNNEKKSYVMTFADRSIFLQGLVADLKNCVGLYINNDWGNADYEGVIECFDEMERTAKTVDMDISTAETVGCVEAGEYSDKLEMCGACISKMMALCNQLTGALKSFDLDQKLPVKMAINNLWYHVQGIADDIQAYYATKDDKQTETKKELLQLDAIERVAAWLNGAAAAGTETGQYTGIIQHACRQGVRYLQAILNGNPQYVIAERSMMDSE